jgi:hypothetical protein
VNAVCPRLVKTDFPDGAGHFTVEEVMPHIVELCVMGKEGRSAKFLDAVGDLGW